MATQAAVEAAVERILREELYIEVPSGETDLLATGAVDSLTLVELLVRLEADLGKAIPLEELDVDDFRSIGRIARRLSQDGFSR